MEALPLRAGRANCMSNIQQDMIEQTLAILASMMQQAAHDATLYCAEAKRTVIMPRDIELALKRLVLPGSAYWTRDDGGDGVEYVLLRILARMRPITPQKEVNSSHDPQLLEQL
jgi:histone H3/H4